MSVQRLTVSEEDAERIRDVERLVREGRVEMLVARLVDRSWAVRRSVVAGLAQLGERAVPALWRALAAQRDHEGRIAALVDALVASRGDADRGAEWLIARGAPAPLHCDAAQVLGRRRTRHAVPLLERLLRHENDNVVVAAIEALGRIGGGAGVDALLEIVETHHFFRLFPAIDVLGASRDPRIVGPMSRLLDNPIVALDAARALGRSRSDRAIEPLASRLTSADEAFVRVIAVALCGLITSAGERGDREASRRMPRTVAPPESARALASALPSASVEERAATATVLGAIGGPDAVAPLFSLARDPDEQVASAAAAALDQLHGDVGDELLAHLGAIDPAERVVALRLVRGRTIDVARVRDCLFDEEAIVRIAACDALARIGDTSVVGPLFQLLDDPDARVTQAAQGAIQSLGSRETERLALAAARDASISRRRIALRIVAYFGYASALPILADAVRDREPTIVEAAIDALALIDNPRAVTILVDVAHSPNPRFRSRAMRTLGKRGRDPRAIEALEKGLLDDDAWTRYYACQALGRLCDESMIRVLGSLLADPAGQVRVAAIEAVAQLRTAEAFDALTRAARSPDADMRRAALVRLGHTRRSEGLPLLVEAAADANPSTRLVAISALAELDAPEIVSHLKAAASDSDETVASAAVELLIARRGAAAAQAVAELIARPQFTERISHALALPGGERLAGIVAALKEADPDSADLLAMILARARREETNRALIALLQQGPLEARRAVARALTATEHRDARAALEVASATDPDPDVRRLAALALET
jgi:HEAT repeat protein